MMVHMQTPAGEYRAGIITCGFHLCRCC